MNSKWQFLSCASIAFSERYDEKSKPEHFAACWQSTHSRILWQNGWAMWQRNVFHQM